jgi:hypothetical protein
MSLPVNPKAATSAPARQAGDVFLVWNRRLHYYVGLYLLFFCWLFALTGLLLNHPEWEFAQFWPSRVQTSGVQDFRGPVGATDSERAADLMKQLGIVGEVQWPNRQPVDGPFTFQVTRPGLNLDLKADLATGRATLNRTELNAWGVMHVLHAFTGVRAADPVNQRDWILTTAWALTMDAVAVGLVFMVFSSLIMWFRIRGKRRGGTLALIAGCVCCALLLMGAVA